MNVIQNDIRDAIEKELTAAKERFPMFASMHEAIAVIAEERDEAAAEMENVNTHLKMAWAQVKLNNQTALNCIARLKFDAEKLAVEACQVAAMCEKAVQSAAELNDSTEDNEKC